MKIALIQMESTAGNVEENLRKHVEWIERVVPESPDLIAFPELSLTGYEPSLASSLAMDENDTRLGVFQDRSKRDQVVIAVGLPLRSPNGIYIGMVIFHPDGKKQVYRKQMLHEDEKPFFIAGKEQILLELKGLKVAPAICYEAFQEVHLYKCLESRADIYLACVSKHLDGIVEAYRFIRENSKKHELPMVLINSVGFCDNFLSAGGTSSWSEDGRLLNQLGYSEEGFVTFEYHKYPQQTNQLCIQK